MMRAIKRTGQSCEIISESGPLYDCWENKPRLRIIGQALPSSGLFFIFLCAGAEKFNEKPGAFWHTELIIHNAAENREGGCALASPPLDSQLQKHFIKRETARRNRLRTRASCAFNFKILASDERQEASSTFQTSQNFLSLDFYWDTGNRRRAKLPASTNCRQKMANLHIEGVVRGQWAWFNKWRVLESTLKLVYLLFIDKRRQFPLY